MSLIAGQLHLDSQLADPTRLCNTLDVHGRRYRPDGCGVWSEGSVVLGHCMSHSTPESLDEELPQAIAPLAITADARIDNRDELLNTLEISRGGQVKVSDSELILKAYEKWNQSCVEHLEGDFTFVIYDRIRHLLFCVRSAFGSSPLYYVHTARDFAFASLIRPLLMLSGLPKQLNERAFARFASHTWHSGDLNAVQEPFFKGVNSLERACALTVQPDGSVRKRIFWQPDPSRELCLRTSGEYYEQLRELIVRSVHDRMRSHRPVVCYLSGGLDSSSIACIAARRLRRQGQRLTAISAVLPTDFDGPEEDERYFIDIVKHAEDLDVEYVYPGENMMADEANLMDLMERPCLTPKRYMYRAFHQVAQAHGAGVILDGCGGEAGPTNHARGVLAWMARTGRLGNLSRELRALCRQDGNSIIRLTLRHVVAPHMPDLQALYHRTRQRSNAVGSITLPLNKDFVRLWNLNTTMTPNMRRSSSNYCPKGILAQAIRFTQIASCAPISNGIRRLFPFLDRRIIDFCLAVPARLYHVDGWNRNLIRRAMDGILPPEIQWRKCKARFSPDFYRRFQKEISGLRAEFSVISKTDRARDYYDVDAIIRIVDELDGRPGGETTVEGMKAKLCVQSCLSGIRFLRWFDQLDVQARVPTCNESLRRESPMAARMDLHSSIERSDRWHRCIGV